MMRNSAEILDGTVVQAIPHPFPDSNSHQLLAQSQIIRKMLFQLPPLRVPVRSVHRPLGFRMCFGLIHQIRNPGRNRLNQHLRAFALEEVEHVEVAIAFGDLSPELTGDLDHRFHLGAIDFNAVHLLPRRSQSVEIILSSQMLVHLAEHVERVPENLVALEFRLCPVRRALFNFKRIPVAQVVTQAIYRLAKYALGFAFIHFEGANLINQIIEHVSQMHGVQHAKSEINRELQPWLSGGRLDSVAVFEQENAEAVETSILQSETIFRLIHAEPTWAA